MDIKRPKVWLWLGGITASLLIICSAPTISFSNPAQEQLPALQVHPLPPSLVQWQPSKSVGDYFAAVEPTTVGYLIWSEFPIAIYLETASADSSARARRDRQWLEAVRQAVREWNAYLPLQEGEEPETANIAIRRVQPPMRATLNRETGQFDIPRARAAQTNYQFYLSSDTPPQLAHRMTILIRPGMSYQATLSATRHELGHALGIWGHSSQQTDALYYAQTSTSPPISERDINTLKKIYQQPTRLGWSINRFTSKARGDRPLVWQ